MPQSRRASDFETWREGSPYTFHGGQDGRNVYAATLPTMGLSKAKLEVMVGMIPEVAGVITGNGEVWVCYYQHERTPKVYPNLTTYFTRIV